MNRISILVVEDHRMIRESWTHMLGEYPDFHIVAGCGDSDQAIQLAGQMRPDIVLMDISMKPFNGFETTEKVRLASPLSRVIGLSAHTLSSFANKMFSVGAKGYLTKNSPLEEMRKAIILVHGGSKYLCDEIRTALTLEISTSDANIRSLTYKEIQISQYISQGFCSKEIAAMLNVSCKTIEAHRYNIFRKLRVKNLASFVGVFNAAMA